MGVALTANIQPSWLKTDIFIWPILGFFFDKYECEQLFKGAEKRKQILCEVGNQTFGIYLLHIIILWKLPKLFYLWNFLERYNYGILLSVICVFVIGYVFTKMLKKIPGIRRLL